MSTRFAAGKRALGICDVCGFKYKLKQLRSVVTRGQITGIKACPACWDADHPQSKQGMYPVHDPQALRDPRSDIAERAASREIPE